MSHLSTSDADRLGKLLGMLGSSHAGERDAAALAASRFIATRNLTWPQVLHAPAPERLTPQGLAWRRTIELCLTKPGCLRPWEHGFLRDLAGFRRLSAKQQQVLREIADRVLGAERS